MEKRWLAILLLGLALAGSLYTPAGAPVRGARIYDLMSCSPDNPGPGGTLALLLDLESRHEVEVADSISQVRGPGLLLVIGPDKPYTRAEARLIAGLVRSGRLNLLVADETNNSALLLEELGIQPVDGVVTNRSGVGDWIYIVHMSCWDHVIPSALSARLPPSGEILCKYTEDGSPAAEIHRVGKGLVLVVGDSSIFANYLYNGYDGLPPTRDVALRLIETALGGKDRIIFDNSHYNYQETPTLEPSAVLSGILLTVVEGLQSLANQHASPYWLLAGLLAAALPWPAILLYPSREPEPWRDPLEEHEKTLLEVEAARLGLPADSSLEEVLSYLEREHSEE